MKQYGTSPYTVTADTKVVEITYPKEKKPNDQLKPAPIGETPIEQTLFRYGLMTKGLIERALLLQNEKRIDVADSIKVMLREHKLEEYHLERGDESYPDLTFYKLSKVAEKKMKNRRRTAYRYDLADPASVANILITTQWHLAMLESGAKEIKLHGHVEGERKGVFVPVPSLTRYKMKNKKSFVFAAVPAPRGRLRRGLGAFLKNVTEISTHFAEHPDRYGHYCIIVLCDSQEQIEELSKTMASFKETKDCFVLYGLDYDTGKRGKKPQGRLYYVKRSEGLASLTTIDLS